MSEPGGPRPEGSARCTAWDLLRSVFVLMVVIYHSTYMGPHLYAGFTPRQFVFAHQIGASLLLVLSAYFAAASLGRRSTRPAIARWWWSRFARLLPAYVVATLVIWTALRLFAPAGMFYPSVGDLLPNLLMIWNFDGLHQWAYVDGSSWTLPLQLMAFTLAALLAGTRLGRGRGLRVLMWSAVLVALVLWPWRAAFGPVYATVIDGVGIYRWHLFVAGVAVWMATTGRLRQGHAAALLASCVAAHAVEIGSFGPNHTLVTDWWSVLGVGLGVAALLGVSAPPGLADRLPASVRRAVAWFAGVSYGVFLVHQALGYLIMMRLQQAFGLGPGLQTLAMLANGVLLGWLVTRYVERPAHRVLLAAWDRHTRRHTRRPALATIAREGGQQGPPVAIEYSSTAA